MGMTDAKAVGQRLRARREELGLSQAAVAGEDVSDSYLSLIERGRRSPSQGVLELLARRLRCSADWLATGENPVDRHALLLRLREGELSQHSGESSRALEIALSLLSDPDLPSEILPAVRRLQGATARIRLRHSGRTLGNDASNGLDAGIPGLRPRVGLHSCNVLRP